MTGEIKTYMDFPEWTFEFSLRSEASSEAVGDIGAVLCVRPVYTALATKGTHRLYATGATGEEMWNRMLGMLAEADLL